MSGTEINYREFIKYVHQKFADDISSEEVEDLLHLEESYNKDSPASLGKSLSLNRLIFSGTKLSGDLINFDEILHKGINIWIADNHKGKSTIFKIIKFALTGNDSIKKDIKLWIDEILLEFTIGRITYTCHIDRTGRDKGALYSFNIDQYNFFKGNQKLDTLQKDVEFVFNSRQDFEDKLQKFFFEQFSFYNLKYTQKTGGKDSFDLTTSSLSWSTYFKSIYLESSNYEYLFFDTEKFGAQGKKIFEMILGLPLTYPINMLNVQRDRVSEKIGQIKLVDKSKTDTTKSTKEKLDKRYQEVLKELELINKNTEINFNERPLIEEYTKIQDKVNQIRINQRTVTDSYQAEKAKLIPLEEEIRNLESDKRKIDAEIIKLKKQELNLELYKQSQSFFSNLDIKTCPHCELQVSDAKKENERDHHICSLCGEESTEQKVEESEILQKANQIKDEINGHNDKLKKINTTINDAELVVKKVKKSIQDHYGKMIAIPSIDSDNKRLKEIENEIALINKEREKHKNPIEKKDQLIKEEAVLNFQLEEIKKMELNVVSEELVTLNLKKTILDYALSALEKKRIILNKDILGKLEQLILNEINAFGLKSITQIEINDRYELIFTQNDVPISFNDLTEGEKLRVKLAFYLSLIQLDIEHSLGRHPRFLIFDSPGSEEMVPKHLQGLSDIFKNINDRFKDQLQIFVGSALREFSQITDKDRTFIKNEDEFVF
ncbi:hypothetical protein ASF10_22165 [Flavobacterium sp. Leaf82]|uniref:hypothetical protein n=1 Tax=Flavobacterium sp. Leaf82 TaxID=1736238 RepID=UPI0006F2F76C|nr:hypothetical protein [Flavobacterium sp. Leaf82]KQO31345.1 hypothetical protein ASF10_22165 [Flavobacterium sp. Leaf82]